MNTSHLCKILAVQTGMTESSIHILDFKVTKNGGYGVCTVNKQKLFFKYKNCGNFESEYKINQQLSFPSPRTGFYQNAYSPNEDVMTWEYIDSVYSGESLLHNFIYNPRIDSEKRLKKYHDFWTHYYSCITQNYRLSKRQRFANAPLFEDRMFNGRFTEFYGPKLANLFTDYKDLMDTADDIKSALTEALEVFKNQEQFIIAYTHGDLHDFNIAIMPDLLFDLEYTGYNSLLSEVACYLLYLTAQANVQIGKYYPRFFESSRLVEVDPVMHQKLKNLFWSTFTLPIINIYGKNNLNWENEFCVRLIARILGIKNILLFELADRKLVYRFLNDLLIALRSGNLQEFLEDIAIQRNPFVEKE